MSTGFEALIGYLYLDNKIDRIQEIITYALGGNNEKDSQFYNYYFDALFLV